MHQVRLFHQRVAILIEYGVIMKIKSFIKNIIPQSVLKSYKASGLYLEKFAYSGTDSIAVDIEKKYGPQGKLLEIFSTNTGNMVHKWHHYICLFHLSLQLVLCKYVLLCSY